ncbi:MAG TPA: glucose 1-dehydrogenase [Chloroflexota bacterium]|nr:glucose 1-dehydrogenase [Chloroflexota bacterium]
MGLLDGKVGLVTGGGRGIGRAIALRFAAEGANVVIADVNEVGARSVADEVATTEARALAIRVDVTKLSDIRAMVRRATDEFGRIDVLANNAGVIRVARLLDVTEEHWDLVMSVNARAVFFVLQAVARQMVEQDPGPDGLRGRIINTASIAGRPGGRPMFAPYAASKTAVISITHSAAAALAPYVTVNAICPGRVETAMWEQIDTEWGELEGLPKGEVWREQIAHIPLGRPERPEDVANVAAFLAGPDATYMTGQAVTVDGGLVMS